MSSRMMHTVVFSTFFAASIVFSQPSFTACTGNPHQPGDTVTTQPITAIVCDTTGITAGDSGANVTWDFSALVTKQTYTTPLSKTVYYAVGATPWGSNFPKATIAQKSPQSTTYQYQLYTTDTVATYGQYTTGTKTSGACQVLSVPQVYFLCPMTYLKSFTNEAVGWGCGQNMWSVHHLQTQQKYDGYGTLKLPYGTIRNVARFHTQTMTNDSIYIFNPIDQTSTFSYVNRMYGDQYQWYTSGFNLLLGIVKVATASTVVRQVNYMVDSTAVTSVPHIDRPMASASQRPSVVITGASRTIAARLSGVRAEATSITIFDCRGHVVASAEFGPGTSMVSLADVPPGTYIYQLSRRGRVAGAGMFVNTDR